MLIKTRGIVLNHLRFKETSIISKIYTEAVGVQSYLVNQVYAPRPKTNPALFQPLTLLNMVAYHRQNQNLHRLSEINCSYPYKSIPFQIKKTGIGIFLAEVLSKTLKESYENISLFEFLFTSLQALDLQEINVENFHLQFLLKLTKHLGFEPESPQLLEKEVENFLPGQSSKLTQEHYQIIDQLKRGSYGEEISMTNLQRRETLEIILDFFKVHVNNFREIKSSQVLKEVMN